MAAKRKYSGRISSPTVEDVFQVFLTDKAAAGISPATVRAYSGHLSAVGAFLDLEQPIDQVTSWTVKQAVAEMARSDLSRNSIRSYTATLKTFFSWCADQDLCQVEVQLFKAPESVPETYTDDELKKLLRHPSRRCSFAELRAWAIVNLLVNNGLRAASLREIRIKDVLLDQSCLLLRHTKRGRTQMLPLSGAMSAVLKEYMRSMIDTGPEDWLFPMLDGSQLSHNALRHLISRYNASRGVTKTGIHAFRHTFARLYLVECGGDALKLQRLLGHSTLDMTKHYVRLYDQDLIADFQKHSPLERIKAKK